MYNFKYMFTFIFFYLMFISKCLQKYYLLLSYKFSLQRKVAITAGNYNFFIIIQETAKRHKFINFNTFW